MWAKKRNRLGNIIHRVAVLCGWVLGDIFFCFYNCHFSTVYHMSLLVWPVLGFRFQFMPHHLAPLFRNLSPGPLTMSTPVSQGPVQSEKCSFYACYHANGGGPIFVTVSCLRLFVFTIVSFHMSYVYCLVCSIVNCQQSVCLIAIKLKSSLN